MSNKNMLNILIVDNQPQQVDDTLIQLINDYSECFGVNLSPSSERFAVTTEQAFQLLEKHQYHLIILDIHWGDGALSKEGISILKEVKESIHNNIPIIMLTGYEDQGYQSQCLELGCDGFLAKDLDLLPTRVSSIEYIIEKALRMADLRRQFLDFEDDKGSGKGSTHHIPVALIHGKNTNTPIMLYGTSRLMSIFYQELIRIAAEPASPNVLLRGKTGVGKSTAARLIHLMSSRSKGPFREVVLNAIPADLIESTLFGIDEKVATLVRANTGLIEDCDHGTLFLDEIGDLPLAIQVKLLRAIRDGVINHVGGKTDIKVDFKLITATSLDLEDLVRIGSFRLDLYQRICGIRLEIPSLRERFTENPEELGKLIQKEMEHRRFTFEFSKGALKHMLNHNWPGNYAELRTLINNLSLKSSSFVDEEMVIPHLISIDESSSNEGKNLSEIFNIDNHKLAVNNFKREHVKFWIKKMGNFKTAAVKMGIDESTIHRILTRDQEDV